MKTIILTILFTTLSLFGQTAFAANTPDFDANNKEQLKIEQEAVKHGLANTFDAYPTSSSYIDLTKPVHIVSEKDWIKSDPILLGIRSQKGKTHNELIAKQDKKYMLALSKSKQNYIKAKKRVIFINKNQKEVNNYDSFENKVANRIEQNGQTIKELNQIYQDVHTRFHDDHSLTDWHSSIDRALSDIPDTLKDLDRYRFRLRIDTSDKAAARFIKHNTKFLQDYIAEIVKNWVKTRDFFNGKIKQKRVDKYYAELGYNTATQIKESIEEIFDEEGYSKQLSKKQSAVLLKVKKQAIQLAKAYQPYYNQVQAKKESKLDDFLND